MILKATPAIGLATPPLRRFAIAPAPSPPNTPAAASRPRDRLHYDKLALWGVGLPLFTEIFFQKIGMTIVVAGAAVFQYCGQYFLPHNVVFPLEFLLGPFLIKNFNHVIPIAYGSSIFKSNGMFLAEPSFLSQAMALSFIIERLFFRR